MSSALSALERDGFAVARNVLSQSECARYRSIAAELYRAQNDEQRAARFSTGSLIPFWTSQALGELIAGARLADLLRTGGFSDPRFSNGYVVHKPPRSPRMFWHQDWFAWGHAASYFTAPLQVGCLIYLQPTERKNGALRLIPASHRRRSSMHHPTSRERIAMLRRGEDLSHPEFGSHPDEITIDAGAGDAILLDARLLHATHDNASDEGRSVLLAWYATDFAACPGEIRARYGDVRTNDAWPSELAARVRAQGTYQTEGDQSEDIHDPDDRLRW